MILPDTRLDIIFRLNPFQKEGLRKLRIETVAELFYHFPSRYGEKIEVRRISDLVIGESSSIVGRVVSNTIKKAFYKKIPLAEVILEDESGKIKSVWYHQAYMAKKVAEGETARITGMVGERKGEKYFANPEIEPFKEGEIATAGSLFGNGETTIAPVYPESKGITSLWIRHAIDRLFKQGAHEEMKDPLEETVLVKYNLPNIRTALFWIHFPRNEKDVAVARKRFSFEEIFLIQLTRQKSRKEYEEHPFYKIAVEGHELRHFISQFPFALTHAQSRCTDEILKDFVSGKPMIRLLEGDVGSGKTAVAAISAFATVKNSAEGQPLQVAYMAPTELLAKQHFESFIKYFNDDTIEIGLLTGACARKFPSKLNTDRHTPVSRAQLLKWTKEGKLHILIGTHALIQKSVSFKHLALAIVDEQHRFGTAQRAKLIKKDGVAPHLLSMTATPIPRTLALTIYGDLDLAVIDEMPTGRKPIITKLVRKDEREKTYEEIRAMLAKGKQLYVICPRIDAPDPMKEMALDAKSAKEEAERLKRNIFPEFKIEVLHGKMPTQGRSALGEKLTKESVMKDFNDGKIQILVATSVVEVGVNVPNATMIIIEGAERFGLAQLHQFRGRVMRSSEQAYCYIFSESKGENSRKRLSALTRAKNGFELAEYDLAIRGAGALSGSKQWGISDVGMEAIKNLKMVEFARAEARALIASDPTLSAHQNLAEITAKKSLEIHLE